MEGSFIGRGNWSTKRKPATCRKKLVNFTSTWTALNLVDLLLKLRSISIRHI